MGKIKLSVIVPAYHQQKTIYKDLSRISKLLKSLRYPSELICVVDGSSADKTLENAKRLEKIHPNVHVIGYPKNRGKGYAVRFGMAKARGDLVAFIDAGMDINPNGLAMLLEHFEWYNADIIIGSKRHPASKVNYPWQRKILSFGYQLLVRLLFGLNVRDTQVGLKCYRRDVLEKVLPRLVVKTYAFDIEILAVAYHLGYKRIFEAPVEVYLEFGDNSVITSKRLLYYIYLMAVDTLAVFYRMYLQRFYDESNRRQWVYDPELNFRIVKS